VSRRLAAAIVLIALASCAPKPPLEPALEIRLTNFTALPGWESDDLRGAVDAFRDSCTAFQKQGPARAWSLGSLSGTNADWLDLCQKAQPSRDFFEQNFVPAIVTNRGNDIGLITGYFEPELKGARAKSARFSVPLYKRPPDLVNADLGQFREEFKGKTITGRVEGNRFVPYPAREIIEKGALAGKQLEILWVDDAIETFFLHIQGSGRVVLENGETVRVGYDAQNGHIYRAIGRDLVERGEMKPEQVNLDSIVQWLRAHPTEAQALMNKNPSYVFFREIKGRGPIGAQGVPLTPGRSLAIDRKFLPLGAPVWLDTTDPRDGAPIRRLMVTQDTGGAITGPVRADLFWGAGPEARAGAGAMKQPGRLFVLVPRSVMRTSQLN
jgi:membrane-bound lytic murein transglycosylase A